MRVRTVRSGVSRGTETLVFRGGVPPSQYMAMRAPFQEGDFPGPVKYGYLNVGTVEEGPAELRGRTVFCLYPHQTAYVVPAGAVTVVPDEVPPARAVLAGTVETAVNALWDAAPLVGRPRRRRRRRDGRLLRRPPARPVPGSGGHARRRGRVAGRGRRRARGRLRAAGRRRRRIATWSCTRARRPPGSSARSTCSRPRARCSTSAGTATPRCGSRWAARSTRGRLGLRASQVGTVSPARSARRTTADRLALALDLLRDPAFDVAPHRRVALRRAARPSWPRLAERSLPALCHTITYDGA